MAAANSMDLFLFLARQIEAFLRIHHNEHFETHLRRREEGTAEQEMFDLGFTFSFPVRQLGINKGTLIRWTKGYNIPDAVGHDVCALLQSALDQLELPVRVAALVNDTVGTLMARSYTSTGKTPTFMGAIFGTGTNGAYLEKIDRITKLEKFDYGKFDKSTGEMLINAEWGSFDNHLSVLPNTVYDQQVDADSNNPGIQMFEKRVSGMFLGEILRRALLDMHENPSINLFRPSDTSDVFIPRESTLYKQWGIDTSLLSLVEADKSANRDQVRKALRDHLKIEKASTTECEAVQILGHAIAIRAARLGAVPFAAIVMSTGKLQSDEIIDVGVDGSLIEFYPNFEGYIRDALKEIPEVNVAGEKRIRIGISKDGSGVGAALIALVAGREATAMRKQ